MESVAIEIVKALFDGSWYLAMAIACIGVFKGFHLIAKKFAFTKLRYVVALLVTTALCGMILSIVMQLSCLVPNETTCCIFAVSAASAATLLVILGLVTLALRMFLSWATDHCNREDSRIPNHKLLHLIALIPESLMTKKQRARAIICQAKLLIKLGAMSKAAIYVDRISDKSPNKPFLKSMIAFYQGDLEGSRQLMKESEKAGLAENDKVAAVELIINRGVEYVSRGDLSLANEEFERALTRMKQQRVSNRTLAIILYQDYISNLARTGNVDKAYELIRELEGTLNFKKSDDAIVLLNTELMLIREAQLGRSALNELVERLFESENVLSHLKEKSKLVVTGSLLRVICEGEGSPFSCLDYIDARRNQLLTLEPADKHLVMSNLHELFARLATTDESNAYSDLAQMVQKYIENDARLYFEGLLVELPEECVYQRAHIFRELYELGTLPEREGACDADEVESYLRSAITLYQDNGLGVQQSQTALRLIRSLLHTVERKKLTQAEARIEAAELLRSVERNLALLLRHPGRTELVIGLSLYYGLLGDGKKCISYYRQLQKDGLSLDHYTIGVKHQRLIAAICSRVHAFSLAIATLQADNLSSLSAKARGWIASFPYHDGIAETALIARFVLDTPFCFVRGRAVGLDRIDGKIDIHAWMEIPELNLSIDITYPQFSGETGDSRTMFLHERHPLESGRCKLLALQTSHFENIPVPPDLIINAEALLNDPENTYLDEVYQAVLLKAPEGVISREELNLLISDWLTPVKLNRNES
ncbi:hypothetical protein [Adlercreutzia sp. ZJ242]|uniref:hypothetical protein n=1 Tax=Adlercreutzia sp. ZJ242 TaxID=2709409 RepID=UPI0013EADAAD|nr:hypothetical protein [Adlercreutzia sp. ZJ242]